MAIDLMALEPNKVSRDIRGYSFLFYGPPKVGKTTIATRFPKHLLLGFEKGYSALPGIMALPINSWAEFIQVLNQLKADKKKADVARAKGENYEQKFQTIIIDIADLAYSYCETYILAQNSVSKIADVPYGAGYGLLSNEFDSKMRSIVQMGYGLILISHEQTYQNEDNEDIKTSTCTLSKRAKNICTRLVDIYGYISIDNTENGAIHTLHTRKTPEWDAGSRFKYMSDSVLLDYNEIVKAINDSIDKMEKEITNGSDLVVEDSLNHYEIEVKPSFSEIRKSIDNLISTNMEKAEKNNSLEDMQVLIGSIISKYLG